MLNYGELAQTVSGLLRDFGLTCTVTVETDGTYDVETGEVNSEAEVFSGVCVFGRLSEKHANLFGGLNGSADGTLVLAGDVLITASASCRLTSGCVLQAGRERWRIVNVMPIQPADVVVAYQAQARRL